MDDPVTTNIPSSWCIFICKPETVGNLFRVLSAEFLQNSVQMKTKAAQSLQHLACVRHSLFESIDARVSYVRNYLTEIIKFIQSPQLHNFVLKER